MGVSSGERPPPRRPPLVSPVRTFPPPRPHVSTTPHSQNRALPGARWPPWRLPASRRPCLSRLRSGAWCWATLPRARLRARLSKRVRTACGLGAWWKGWAGRGARVGGQWLRAGAHLFTRTPVPPALYPIDTIKTRLQLMRSGGGLRALLQSGGGRALYAGVWGNLAGVMPASAIFMGVYEPVKHAVGERASPSRQWLGPLVAGASAGLAASVVRVPTEVVKQRMQSGPRVGWAGVEGQATSCARSHRTAPQPSPNAPPLPIPYPRRVPVGHGRGAVHPGA